MTDAIKTGTLLFVGAAEGDGLSLGAILRDSDWQLRVTFGAQQNWQSRAEGFCA